MNKNDNYSPVNPLIEWRVTSLHGGNNPLPEVRVVGKLIVHYKGEWLGSISIIRGKIIRTCLRDF
ncbi:MAG: hypothetical protein NZ901_04290 [Geminocystis sp.]|nr:hypothetical protein [Geminocystis sp.]MCX8079372.1 hypothetical protein [Geminocystis sp.]HIK38139.1 hypothetical protein [Geminocystis sp. M7585_C2015_104]